MRKNAFYAGIMSQEEHGCGQPGFHFRVGLVPIVRGVFAIWFRNRAEVIACPDKVIPYSGDLLYQFPEIDLNRNIYDSLPDSVKGDDINVLSTTAGFDGRNIFIVQVQ